MKINHLLAHRPKYGIPKRFVIAVFFMLAMATALWLPAGAAASCIDLEDVPLDTMEQAAPGLVMFVIDDSGSMDWEILCRGEDSALFEGDYGYIFDNPGDNLTNTGVPDPLENRGSDANKWKSQWAGHNLLYYDPAETYSPWPGYENADIHTPKADPALNYTLDLDETYSDFGETGSEELSSQDILEAGGVIVDNGDTVGASNELIIDNSGPVSPATGDFGRNWPWSCNWNTSEAYNGSACYSNDTNRYADSWWRYSNLIPGEYDVYIRYADYYDQGTVTYSLYDDWDGDNEIASEDFDQSENGGQWHLLAQDVYLEDSARVAIHHYVNHNYDHACADAVRLVPKFEVTQSALFESSSGWRTVDSNRSGYNGGYLESYAGDQEFWARWTASNLDPGVTYNVYARWDTDDSRSRHVNYTTFCDSGEINYDANQEQNGEDWILIAENATFSTGEGVVELRDNGNWLDFCADAVAFMPVGTSQDLNLVRAHYYVKGTDGNVYLVNLDGNIRYFLFEDLDNDDIVDGNDELESKTTSEAISAGIYTGRTYDEERQNFANWYSYYRKRHLTAKNAIARVIKDMQGVYIGLQYINASRGDNYNYQSFRDSNSGTPVLPVWVTVGQGEEAITYDETQAVLDILYASLPGGGTPLREGLESAGEYFQGLNRPGTFPDPANKFSDSSYPYYNDVSGTCQQAFTILMTDGFWNGSFTRPPGMLSDQDSDGHSNTLADVSMFYYEEDLQPDIDNNVPVNSKDTNNAQHMVTYSLSFGMDGSITQSDYPDCPPTCPDWPEPSPDDQTTIDDLWHAAVNGKGLYVNAASPQEMVEAMKTLGQNIMDRLGSSAALATNSIQRQVGTVIYQGTYNTAGWFGDVEALRVNLDGSVDDDDPIWRASDEIPQWDNRKIISFDGSSTIDFDYDNLSAGQRALLSNNAGELSEDDLSDYLTDLVNFLRGETKEGSGFRVRSGLIGDIVHSAPFYYKGEVYIGSNDGMLHALNATTGQEIFCYVPNMVYGHLSELSLPSYNHKYYVDGTATAATVNNKDILVCGLGKGAKGYFGLNITNPGSPVALWEYTGNDDLGYSFSKAIIINTEEEGRVVMFGNGYDSVSETAALFFLDPEDGSLVAKIDTGETSCNGLATPSAADVDGDGAADFVFAGDLHGNMWKFDIRGAASGWKVYYGDQPLVSVGNSAGVVQPITTAPEVMLDCARSDFSRQGAGMMVLFGTGRYLNNDDFGNADIQSFYGVWDWGDIWEKKSGYDIAKTKYLGIVEGAERLLSNIDGASLQEQTVSDAGNGWKSMSNNQVEWYDPETNTGEHMGWVFDMPAEGERGVREPDLIGNGVLELISIIPSSSPCECGGNSILYRVSACSGGYTSDPQFDTNDDGKIDEEDENFGGKEMENMIFEGISIGDQRYYPDTEAGIDPEKKEPIPLGMQYFRVIQ